MSLPQSLAAAAAGAASHLGFFVRNEHHMNGLRYVQAFLLLCCFNVGFLVKAGGNGLGESVASTASLAGWFLGGLYSSLLIYRLFFNPLNSVPGPVGARVSNFYLSFQLGKLDSYLRLQKLHARYGKYVRIGVNDLSIIDPDVVMPANGPNSKFTKSPWYDGDAPLTSMHTSRDKALHDRRRRVWAPAFSDKALRGYEDHVDQFNKKFVAKMTERVGKPVDMSKWCMLYGFDVMGDLAFGQDYGMIESGKQHWAIELMTEGMKPLGFQFPMWFFRVLVSIPGLAAGYQKFIKFTTDELVRRVRHANTGTDIMSWLLKAYDKSSVDPAKDPLLQGDARLIIVAGSDTTSATLTHAFYNLAKDPSQVKKLRDELVPICQDGTTLKDLQNAPHLNGVINETLRLHPPVPSGVSRKTPPEGMQIGDNFIPGGAVFVMPQYVIGRDERVYAKAAEFIPERWYSEPELIKHKDAFAPFSTGPFGCIGKNLALMELRTLIAQMVMKFDVTFAPGEDGRKLLYEAQDHFTMSLPELHLVFTEV